MPVKLRRGMCELEDWDGNGKEGEISDGDKETISSAVRTNC